MRKKTDSSFKRKPERTEGDRKEPKRRTDDPRKKSFDKESGGKPFREQKERPERGFRKKDEQDAKPEGGKRSFEEREKRSFGKGGFPERVKRENDKPAERKFSPNKRKDNGFEKADRPERKSGFEDKEQKKRSFEGNSFEKRSFPERIKRDKDQPEGRKFSGFKKREDRVERTDKPKGREGFGDRDQKKERTERKPFEKRSFPDRVKRASDQPEGKKFSEYRKKEDRPERADRPVRKEGAFDRTRKPERKERFGDKDNVKKRFDKRPFKKETIEKDAPESKSYPKVEAKTIDAPMTLNKYISHSGECSRRDAAELVKQGKVRVNGELVLEPGYRIVPGDQVTLSGKKLTPQKGLVYVLLNKPKGFITTTEDPEERKTVMDLVANSGVDRLFPVGRLDRNTTGVLLLTNDGTLAHKLSHPSYNIKKIYHVTLDKNLTRPDYDKIVKGVELEDGLAQVDALAYLENRHELGLEIHSGRNRIVRRIFESLGYSVEKLDRVMYAGLTKKNVTRGKWRFLTEREIVLLKHFKN